MNRLSKDDYNEAVCVLKRYNYNCIVLMDKRTEILGLSTFNLDGMPKAPYNISDTVFNQYIRLQEDSQLNKALKEINIVKRALSLVNEDSKKIFEDLYQKGYSKWQIIDDLHTSEETYKRRKRELIYAVDKELKKS